MAEIKIGNVSQNVVQDTRIELNKEDITGNIEENLVVTLKPGSKYQIVTAGENDADIVVKVTNSDGTSYNIVLVNLASYYSETTQEVQQEEAQEDGTAAGEIISKLVISIEGSDDKPTEIANFTDIADAMAATAAGEENTPAQNNQNQNPANNNGNPQQPLESNLGSNDDNPEGQQGNQTQTQTVIENEKPIVTDVFTTDSEEITGTNTITGTLVASDANQAQTHEFSLVTGTVAVSDTTGVNAITLDDDSINVVIDPTTGVYTITADFSNLGVGESATLTFDYTATDSGTPALTSDAKTVTLVVTGTNDQPEVSDVTITDTLIETDGLVSVYKGQLEVTDLDDTDTHTFQLSGTPASSSALVTALSVTVNPDGTYSVDGNFDALGAKESATITFDYTATDNSGTNSAVSEAKTVTLTVTGSNDGATITASNSEDTSVTEAGESTKGDTSASGKLTVSDLDDGENVFDVPTDLTGTYGTFTFDEDGNWSYTLTADMDSMNEGDIVNDSLKVSSLDGTASQTITVSINGANDAPEVTIKDSEITYKELDGKNKWQLVNDAITTSDIDKGSSIKEVNISLEKALYGSKVQLATNNSAEFKALLPTLKIVNDKGTEYTANAKGKMKTAASTELTITKLDGSNLTEAEAETIMQAVKFATGHKVPSEAKDVVINFSVTDENDATATSSVTVDVIGTNDTPIIKVVDRKSKKDAIDVEIAEDNKVDLHKQLNIDLGDYDQYGAMKLTLSVEHGTLDIDLGKLSKKVSIISGEGTSTVVLEGSTGNLNKLLDGKNHGAITYSPDENYNGLDNLNINLSDKGDRGFKEAVESKIVPINIKAVNDAPEAVDVALDNIKEDNSLIITEKELLANTENINVDFNEKLNITNLSIASGNGTLTENKDDSWTFTPDDDWNGDVNFDFTVTDSGNLSDSAKATLTVDAVNDAAVISGDLKSTIHEDSASVSGVVTHTDVDNTDNVFRATEGITSENKYGTYSVSANGTWTYVLDNAKVQYLDDGEVATDSIVVIAEDGTVSSVSLTITGAAENYQPIISDVTLDQTVTYDFSDQQVNTYTNSNQDAPSITSLADGGYVIVWQSYGQDGSSYGIYAQRFDKDSNQVGDEIRVNTTTNNSQQNPSVESLEDGGFIVTWENYTYTSSYSYYYYYGSSSTTDYDIYTQRFDSNGQTVGSETLVNVDDYSYTQSSYSYYYYYSSTYTNSNQQDASITGLKDGGYVVTWESYNQDGSGYAIYAQRHDADGNRVGSEVRVNTTTYSDQMDAEVTALDDGGYIVTWVSNAQDGSGYGIYTQRFDSDGDKDGGEVKVNTTTYSTQYEPDITALSDGGYVVTWSSYQDGSGYGIYTQQFDAKGDTVGSETQVNTHTTYDQRTPSISSLDDGGYVITWHSYNQDGSGQGIFAQRFDANGDTVGTETQVNTHTTYDQYDPAITSLEDGGYVITWRSYNQDGSGQGIFAQRFDVKGEKVGTPYVSRVEELDGTATVYTGQLEITSDEDVNDTHTFQMVADSLKLSASDDVNISDLKVTINPNGSYNVIGNFDELSAEETAVVSFKYTATDSSNTKNAVSEAKTVTITVYGTNDKPVVEDVTIDDVILEGDGITDVYKGQLSVDKSIDISDTYKFKLYGTPVDYSGIASDLSVTINENGSYTLSGNFDKLAKDETAKVTFQYTAVDQELSSSDPKTVTLTITGTSDAPTVEDVELDDVIIGQYDYEETQVNTYTNSNQTAPSITALKDGGYVIVWQSYGQDGSSNGVYAQRFDENNNQVGDEIRVNTTTSNNQQNSSVESLEDGGFIVTWENYTYSSSGYYYYGSYSYDYDIYTQRFDSDGDKVGTETLVNVDDYSFTQSSYSYYYYYSYSYTYSNQQDASITGLKDGGYVVTWESYNQDGSGNAIYAQRHDADGNRVGSEVRVNTYTSSDQIDAEVTALEDGGYIVTWVSNGQDGSGYGIYAQRFDSDGDKDGSEVKVNTTTSSTQYEPDITALSDGGYVVTWSSYGQDGSGYGVYAQQFDANGATVGTETQVNTYTSSEQRQPSISSLDDGGYVITWASYNQDGSGEGIYAQRFDANGDTVGTETLINTHTSSNQYEPAITSLEDGGYVITWRSDNQDGSGQGVFAQRFNSNGEAVGQKTIFGQDTGVMTVYEGQLETTDIDNTDGFTFQLVENSAQSSKEGVDNISVVINENGSYTISADFDGLAEKEEAELTFEYTSTDEHGVVSEAKTVSLTVIGTDNTPDITMDGKTLSIASEDIDGGEVDMAALLKGTKEMYSSQTVDTLEINGDHILSNINVNDVIAITDDTNVLKIEGDDADEIKLGNEWTPSSVDSDNKPTDDDEDGYIEYVSSGNQAVKLLIDESVNVTQD